MPTQIQLGSDTEIAAMPTNELDALEFTRKQLGSDTQKGALRDEQLDKLIRDQIKARSMNERYFDKKEPEEKQRYSSVPADHVILPTRDCQQLGTILYTHRFPTREVADHDLAVTDVSLVYSSGLEKWFVVCHYKTALVYINEVDSRNYSYWEQPNVELDPNAATPEAVDAVMQGLTRLPWITHDVQDYMRADDEKQLQVGRQTYRGFEWYGLKRGLSELVDMVVDYEALLSLCKTLIASVPKDRGPVAGVVLSIFSSDEMSPKLQVIHDWLIEPQIKHGAEGVKVVYALLSQVVGKEKVGEVVADKPYLASLSGVVLTNEQVAGITDVNSISALIARPEVRLVVACVEHNYQGVRALITERPRLVNNILPFEYNPPLAVDLLFKAAHHFGYGDERIPLVPGGLSQRLWFADSLFKALHNSGPVNEAVQLVREIVDVPGFDKALMDASGQTVLHRAFLYALVAPTTEIRGAFCALGCHILQQANVDERQGLLDMQNKYGKKPLDFVGNGITANEEQKLMAQYKVTSETIQNNKAYVAEQVTPLLARLQPEEESSSAAMGFGR